MIATIGERTRSGDKLLVEALGAVVIVEAAGQLHIVSR
jgi:hypothetical protein